MTLLGSSGFLEISIREGSAKKILRAKIGDKIQVKLLIRREQAPNSKQQIKNKFQ
jgi:hypothetical protein